MIKDISFIKGVTMSELVITESTFNLIKSAGEPSTSGSFNFIYIILIFLMIMITLSILSYYKKLQREKGKKIYLLQSLLFIIQVLIFKEIIEIIRNKTYTINITLMYM